MIDSECKIEIIPDKQWMVVKTKARCEKKFAEYCRRLSIVHYLPLRKSIRRYSNRKVEFTVPIFSGYVFAQIDPSEKTKLLEPRHSAHVITPDESMEQKLVGELNNIKILVNATLKGTVLVRPEIQLGECVRIKSGVVAGLTGIVTQRKKKRESPSMWR